MKTSFIHLNKVMFVFLMLSGTTCFQSCTKDSSSSEPVSDPVGTVTVYAPTNSLPAQLYNGSIETGDYWLWSHGGSNDTVMFSTDQIVHVTLGIDPYNNLQIVHHYGDISNWGWFQYGGEFSEVGEVSGLGEVKKIPEGGWAKTVAAVKGHGYVLRYRHSYNIYDDHFPEYYTSIYVDDYLLNTYNEIIGVVLKYKNPF